MNKHPVITDQWGRKSQIACPIEEGKPSWDDAPEWAKGLFCDPLAYFWSSAWTVNTYSVEPRPKPA